MLRRLLLSSLAFPVLALAAPRLRIIASFSVLLDMTRQVTGDHAEVASLVPVDGDVHVYEPRPSDLRALQSAGLLVENGLGLEGWMQRLTGAARFSGITVVATTGVTPHTTRQGGGAVATDPHAWQDPLNGLRYVRNILSGLASADPAHAAEYQAAAGRYVEAIRQTDDWIAAQFALIPAEARRVITTHDAFGYFGSRYGVRFLAAEGLSTEAEPSAKAIAALVAQIKREKVHAVFIENMTDPRVARMLAKETGAILGGTVYSDALSPPDGPAPTYLAMLRHNTALVAAALRGDTAGLPHRPD
jgi:zinc/manganese transport system substrate-binding protein